MAQLFVVEDHPDSAEALCIYLKRAGHGCNCMPDGREAINALLSCTPDVLILDLAMPKMDGAALLEKVRSYLRLRALPVVVFTGMPRDALAERAQKFNVAGILTKGKDTLEDVLRLVEKVLPAKSQETLGPKS